MTAEFIVMNLEGIALAADSAGTLTDSKINNNMNKLFMLAPGHSVGLMIYNKADFMGIPWEIIIKRFREKIITDNTIYPRLSDYYDKLIEFIINNENLISNEEVQKQLIEFVAFHICSKILYDIWDEYLYWFAENSKKITETKLIEIASKVFDDYFQCVEKHDLDSDLRDDKGVEYTRKFLDQFGESLAGMRNYIFENFPLSKDNIEKLEKIIIDHFRKDLSNERKLDFKNYSGLVIAGYGKEDLFPKLINIRIENLIMSRLKYNKIFDMQVSLQDPAKISGFAQDDIFQNIVFGRHPEFINCLIDVLQNQYAAMGQDRDQINKNVNETVREIDKRMRERYTRSIYQVVRFLPKDDLAQMAETMVNLTGFMRRVSMSPETVAGPVDVAVISRKDGFIWIKRKHYFDIEYNYHYKMRGERDV